MHPSVQRENTVLKRHHLTGFLLFYFAAVAWAEALPDPVLERECWLAHTQERTAVRTTGSFEVDFANLQAKQVVRTPFQVDFAVKGMGVIPAGTPHPSAGHHHILIDSPLPDNPGDKIPFNDLHRHFGTGQTSTVLDLTPGSHTLRLLFADHEHRPYFVFSREVVVVVYGNRSDPPLVIDPQNYDASCKDWYDNEISRPRGDQAAVRVENLRDGELVTSPLRLNFDVRGMGVAPKGYGDAKHGHFVLKVQSGRVPPKVLDFSNGATQTTLSLAHGVFNLELAFKNDAGDADLLPPARMSIKVLAEPFGVGKR